MFGDHSLRWSGRRYTILVAGAPFDPTKVWQRAVLVPLKWMNAFLIKTAGTLYRTYRLVDYLAEGPLHEVTTDASRERLGGFLKIDGVIVACFSSRISELDRKILRIGAEGSEGQQAGEALAMLVALRLWKSYWTGRRIQLKVRSDSVSALVMIMKMKAGGEGTGLISREVALGVAEACYEPQIGEHVPGVANVLADYLSRLDEHVNTPVPGPLRRIEWASVEPRRRPWWRTL